jgi:alpha-L-arabinofuranosidase
MKHNFNSFLLLLSALAAATLPTIAAPTATISVDVNQPEKPVSPLLYGIFFEEINRAGDGGIYAEMIQNRSFEDADILFHDTPRRAALGAEEAAREANDAIAWSLVTSSIAQGTIALDKSRPLNANNPTSLRLEVTAGGGRVGIASDGFRGTPEEPAARREPGRRDAWRTRFDEATNGGLNIEKGQSYNCSLYARSPGSTAPLTITLESRSGVVLASERIKKVGQDWKKIKLSLVANATDPQARLVIAATQPGTYWLDMISLFPRRTWKTRKNGLRPDLMDAIAAMKPAFVRFPGGCFVEGYDLTDYPRWKDSIGDVAQRPQNHSYWGYTLTNGLGYLEYLQMCEDLRAEPLFVINCGMSHINGGGGNQVVPLDKMGPYVQDALDAIEYANGDAKTTKWGAQRARDGHPAPFGLKLMEIGNENGGRDYHARYALFHDAIKAKYPQVQLVACDWRGVPRNRPLDLIDSHHYGDPASFLSQTTRYDNYDRNGPKVYFGEYAVTQQSGFGNLQAAIGEAAFLTGLERNSDVVKMSSYAPLLNRIGWDRWHPNAINFDQSRWYGTPSYHVQTLFAPNRADRVLPLRIEESKGDNTIRGQIGVGTWSTQAEFKDIKVTQGDKTLYESNFANGTAGWKLESGNWQVVDGVLRQSGNGAPARALIGDPAWSHYTLTLKARKTGGAEGFLILFGASDERRNWFNIGGWGNTEHGIQLSEGTSPHAKGSIETGRWYDIKIEVAGETAKAYLDDQLMVAATQGSSAPSLYAVAGRNDKSGEIILKIVNAGVGAQETTVALNGLKAGRLQGTAAVLNGDDPMAENSLSEPRKIAPRSEAVSVTGPTFTRIFPARSVTVLRLKGN